MRSGHAANRTLQDITVKALTVQPLV